jgi:hypothetical protein
MKGGEEGQTGGRGRRPKLRFSGSGREGGKGGGTVAIFTCKVGRHRPVLRGTADLVGGGGGGVNDLEKKQKGNGYNNFNWRGSWKCSG